ncbi:hypothetical protein OAO55_01385 [Bacteroidales bacterium]|nr:hypothetical protein [Bacteroidales bacterium]
MLSIVDHRAPKIAISNLEKQFDVVLFKTNNQTYNEVSGHPDIFIFQHKNTIIAAQNTPKYIIEKIEQTSAKLIISVLSSGKTLRNSTSFNCSATQHYWFHKTGYTAPEIIQHCKTKTFIQLPQAYSRCSTSFLSDNCIITSDPGVEKALKQAQLPAVLIDPSDITLPGFRYGFFGGTNGVIDNKVYFLGNILAHSWGKQVEEYLIHHEYEPVCLSNGKLYDGGGLFFV